MATLILSAVTPVGNGPVLVPLNCAHGGMYREMPFWRPSGRQPPPGALALGPVPAAAAPTLVPVAGPRPLAWVDPLAADAPPGPPELEAASCCRAALWSPGPPAPLVAPEPPEVATDRPPFAFDGSRVTSRAIVAMSANVGP